MTPHRILEFMHPKYIALRVMLRPVSSRIPAPLGRCSQTQDFGDAFLHSPSIVNERPMLDDVERWCSNLDDGNPNGKTATPSLLPPKKVDGSAQSAAYKHLNSNNVQSAFELPISTL
jgi:hypothetical protein